MAIREPVNVECRNCNGRFVVDEKCLDREEYGHMVNCPYCPNKTQA